MGFTKSWLSVAAAKPFGKIVVRDVIVVLYPG
jgi:hypothetical protein